MLIYSNYDIKGWVQYFLRFVLKTENVQFKYVFKNFVAALKNMLTDTHTDKAHTAAAAHKNKQAPPHHQ